MPLAERRSIGERGDWQLIDLSWLFPRISVKYEELPLSLAFLLQPVNFPKNLDCLPTLHPYISCGMTSLIVLGTNSVIGRGSACMFRLFFA